MDSSPCVKYRITLTVLISVAAILSAIVISGLFLIIPKQRLARELALGEKYLEELKYDEAILHFQEALRIDPRNLDANRGLGDANYGLAETVAGENPAYAVICYQRAADAYETVLEISPGSVFLENRVSQIRRKSDELKEKSGQGRGKPEKSQDSPAPQEKTVTPTPKPTVTPTPTVTPKPTNTPTPEPTEPAIVAWKEAFIDYLSENTSAFGYGLEDIDANGIPELFIDYSNFAEGTKVCLYTSFGVRELTVAYEGSTYIPGGNRIHDMGGHMDYYPDRIYQISGDSFELLGEGYLEVTWSDTESPTEHWVWEGEELSDEEYHATTAKLSDPDKEIFFGDVLTDYDSVVEQIKDY